MADGRVRIGVLGAARIAPLALVRPAARDPEVTVAAVAARDPRRAQRFARRHGIERVHGSYDQLLADPELDAVYVPLPNALHGRWTLAALQAGKHVLVEKPFAANADEAQRVADAAAATDLVVMEAFHYRYHALTERLLALLADGVIGDVTHVRARFHAPIVQRSDIRFDLALAGGALMDTGCYPIHLVRTLTGEEPEVTAATARTWGDSAIDDAVDARLAFPSGVTGAISCGLRSLRGLPFAEISGTRGRIRAHMFLAPQYLNWVTVETAAGRSREVITRKPGTYDAQLAAFAGAVLRGEPFPTTPADAVANMRVIDACYRAAGLPPRRPAA